MKEYIFKILATKQAVDECQLNVKILSEDIYLYNTPSLNADIQEVFIN